MRYPPVALMTILLAGCASGSLRMPPGVTWQQYAVDRGDHHDERSLRLRPEVCDGRDLRPDYGTLNESSFIRFLQDQRYEVQAQRQEVDPKNPELHYVFASVPGFAGPVPLRVAVLRSADDAGRALNEALLQRGAGSWGVHRANVAVLGPAGPGTDDVAFAALTKLVCWGTLTVAGTDDTFVVPGGYAEP